MTLIFRIMGGDRVGDILEMARLNLFSQMPSEILYGKLSDFSKLVWCYIFAENFSKNYFIQNKEIASDFNKSVVTVSRSISELQDGGYIKIVYINNRRQITIKEFIKIKEQNLNFAETNTIALETFFESFPKNKEVQK